MFPCSLTSQGGASWCLTRNECRGRSRRPTRGVALVVCPPLWSCRVQGAHVVPCFCSLLFRSGSWLFFFSFCILLSIICPNCTCTYLFLILYSLYFVARGDTCPSASTAAIAAMGPRSQDPACLTGTAPERVRKASIRRGGIRTRGVGQEEVLSRDGQQNRSLRAKPRSASENLLHPF